MRTRRPRRNTNPAWVQDLSDETLHAMAVHLRIANVERDLTEAQWWLFDRLVQELVYRRRALQGQPHCHCDLCIEPYRNEQVTMDEHLQRDAHTE